MSSGTPTVTRLLRSVVWPALRASGFEKSTSRTAWRTNDDTIDVVYVQAIVGPCGSRLGLRRPDGSSGSAAFGSFSIRAGTYFSVRRVLPYATSIYARPRDMYPPEVYCDERKTLSKTIPQNAAYPPDIWAVNEDGRGADRAVADALDAVRAEALPWFSGNADLEAAFLESRRRCWIMARQLDCRPDQFFRSEDLFAALAIRLEKTQEAIALFEAIVARPFDPEERRNHEQQEETRLRRFERSPRRGTLAYEPLPFWHAGAVNRLKALAAAGG